jgi:hypothetical protein
LLKLVALLKRRPGMTLEEFRDYYETTHSKFAEPLKGGLAVRYVRRYFIPIKHPLLDVEAEEPEFDAMMEMWFKDQAQFEAAMKVFSDPVLSKAIKDDESNLFDVSKIRHCFVDEVDMEMSVEPEINSQ